MNENTKVVAFKVSEETAKKIRLAKMLFGEKSISNFVEKIVEKHIDEIYEDEELKELYGKLKRYWAKRDERNF